MNAPALASYLQRHVRERVEVGRTRVEIKTRYRRLEILISIRELSERLRTHDQILSGIELPASLNQATNLVRLAFKLGPEAVR
jgi:hypothetical protein